MSWPSDRILPCCTLHWQPGGTQPSSRNPETSETVVWNPVWGGLRFLIDRVRRFGLWTSWRYQSEWKFIRTLFVMPALTYSEVGNFYSYGTMKAELSWVDWLPHWKWSYVGLYWTSYISWLWGLHRLSQNHPRSHISLYAHVFSSVVVHNRFDSTIDLGIWYKYVIICDVKFGRVWASQGCLLLASNPYSQVLCGSCCEHPGLMAESWCKETPNHTWTH